MVSSTVGKACRSSTTTDIFASPLRNFSPGSSATEALDSTSKLAGGSSNNQDLSRGRRDEDSSIRSEGARGRDSREEGASRRSAHPHGFGAIGGKSSPTRRALGTMSGEEGTLTAASQGYSGRRSSSQTLHRRRKGSTATAPPPASASAFPESTEGTKRSTSVARGRGESKGVPHPPAKSTSSGSRLRSSSQTVAFAARPILLDPGCDWSPAKAVSGTLALVKRRGTIAALPPSAASGNQLPPLPKGKGRRSTVTNVFARRSQEIRAPSATPPSGGRSQRIGENVVIEPLKRAGCSMSRGSSSPSVSPSLSRVSSGSKLQRGRFLTSAISGPQSPAIKGVGRVASGSFESSETTDSLVVRLNANDRRPFSPANRNHLFRSILGKSQMDGRADEREASEKKRFFRSATQKQGKETSSHDGRNSKRRSKQKERKKEKEEERQLEKKRENAEKPAEEGKGVTAIAVLKHPAWSESRFSSPCSREPGSRSNPVVGADWEIESSVAESNSLLAELSRPGGASSQLAVQKSVEDTAAKTAGFQARQASTSSRNASKEQWRKTGSCRRSEGDQGLCQESPFSSDTARQDSSRVSITARSSSGTARDSRVGSNHHRKGCKNATPPVPMPSDLPPSPPPSTPSAASESLMHASVAERSTTYSATKTTKSSVTAAPVPPLRLPAFVSPSVSLSNSKNLPCALLEAGALDETISCLLKSVSVATELTNRFEAGKGSTSFLLSGLRDSALDTNAIIDDENDELDRTLSTKKNSSLLHSGRVRTEIETRRNYYSKRRELEVAAVSRFAAAFDPAGKSFPVELRVYDISHGMAAKLSPFLIGRRIEGIWHTGVHVYGYEYFFGGGIFKALPKEVEAAFEMTPTQVHKMGDTTIPVEEFEDFVMSIAKYFAPQYYDLTEWNCNHFSDFIIRYLLNQGLPDYVLDLPDAIRRSWMGNLMLKFVKRFFRGGTAPVSFNDPNHPSRIARNGIQGDGKRSKGPSTKEKQEMSRQSECRSVSKTKAAATAERPLMKEREHRRHTACATNYEGSKLPVDVLLSKRRHSAIAQR